MWTADDEDGSFVSEDGSRLAQGWKVNVGFDNFTRVLTDDTIRQSFLRIVVWNFAFAIGTVVITFALGLLVAIALNNPLMRGRTLYRSLIILPYAMPSIAMYLVWREMFNQDFGLINRLLGTDINWFGTTASSMFAILLIQLWLGYNYMFLVITGALQSIPSDLVEAAGVDGAKPFYAFRTITFPLLLVALAPLLITSFAFNFNNFPAIYLTSQGGPFPPDNPSAGGTDILITYTYRLAFGGSGADYGFAAAISVLIFLIVATVSIVGLPSHPGPGGDQLMASTTSDATAVTGDPGTPPPRWSATGRPRVAGSGARAEPPGRHPGPGLLDLPDPVRGLGLAQPGRHPELVDAAPPRGQPGQLPDPLRRVVPAVVRQQPDRRLAGRGDLDVDLRLRRVRVLPLPVPGAS